MTEPRKVLIAGGGVGALEAALALRELAPELAVGLLAPGRWLELAPETVAEVVGGPPAARYDLGAIAADLELELVPDALERVEPHARQVVTRGGATVPYDALLLALGARAGAVLPGALRFAGRRDVEPVRAALAALRETGRPRVAFVAAGSVGWTLPLYELALLVAAGFEEEGREAELTVVTPEAQPLAVFGHAASREVARALAARGIQTRLAAAAESVEGDRLWLAVDGWVPVDLAIALPEPLGPAPAGLPADAHGFVPVDRYGRIPGVPDVWAVGDMTARPLKQGGLTAQQADVAAQSIAAWAGAAPEPEPYRPVLRGLLLTGAEPRFLRRSASSTVPSAASERPLWFPAGKVAGRRLGSYLARREALEH
jgi:sulfide:quinone oxidoreductase